jgi:hypothetical protein
MLHARRLWSSLISHVLLAIAAYRVAAPVPA